MRKQKRRKEDGINFWQSSSDLMTALILVLILVILLLALYLLYTPKSRDGDLTNGEATTETVASTTKHEETTTATTTERREETSGGGGGGGGHGTDIGDYPYDEEGNKSAVYVKVVDGETKKTIKKKGILFELFKKSSSQEKGSLLTLNTYYPKKISYTQFETTKKGVFYLPEKIYAGKYFFTGLNVPKGYDPADPKHFVIKDYYDWPKPYVVNIPLFPSRNYVKVELTDKETGDPIEGADFVASARENIVTLDGTVRLHEGEVADQFGTTNTKGTIKSKKIYLGEYKVGFAEVPEFYADTGETKEVSVVKKMPTLVKLSLEKTKVRIFLTDAKNSPIKGAEFCLVGSNGETQTVKTDAMGSAVFQNLRKNTDYSLAETKVPETYYAKDSKETSLHVDEKGTIEKKVSKDLRLTNYQLRVKVQIKDQILGRNLPNQKMAILDENGNEVKSWTSGKNETVFTDLGTGNYTLLSHGKKKSFTVRQTSKPQTVSLRIFSWQGILIVFGTIFGIGFIVWFVWNRRRKV